MKIKTLYKHLKPHKWYNNLFDEIVKNGSKRYEENVQRMACNPTPKALAELKKLLTKKRKKVTDQEIWEANHNLMMFYSVAISLGYKKLKAKRYFKK